MAAHHSTKWPCFLCHSSILFSPKSSWTLFFLSGQRTQSGLLFALTHTISSGTGRSVSIADANGWISSGHVLSHSQSMVEHLLQKLRSDVHFSAVGLPRSLVATYFLRHLC